MFEGLTEPHPTISVLEAWKCRIGNVVALLRLFNQKLLASIARSRDHGGHGFS